MINAKKKKKNCNYLLSSHKPNRSVKSPCPQSAISNMAAHCPTGRPVDHHS